MFLRYFDSLAIFGNAQLSRIRYFRSLITLRTFSLKCEIFGNDNLFFLSWSAAICDLLYVLESNHRLDRTKKFGITREPVFCWVWMHATPCHGRLIRSWPWAIFCLRNCQRRSSKVYKGCAVPRASRLVYERVGKRASWVNAIVNLTNA